MSERPESVAVTGIGVVSPLGTGREAFWSALLAGESGIAPIDAAKGGSARIGAEVRGFDARAFIASGHLRRMDELSRMIVAASRMALDDARIAPAAMPPERIGIVVGSAIGNVSESVAHLERVFTKGPAAASPMIFPNLVLNAPASYVAMEIGALGINLTVAEGEVTGEQAIALGSDLIRSGRADVVLAGGGDELDPILFDIYGTARALSGQRGGAAWSSPYDVARNGIVLGEGAAMLALESSERARGRGARVVAEIATHEAFCLESGLYDWTERANPPARLRGLARDSRFDLVCGSANSSRRLDACEVDLVALLLGEGAASATLTSIKGAIGDFGAAGALTVAAACLALRDQTVPPLCNLREPIHSAIPLRFAAHRGVTRTLHRALVLGLARGGAGIAVALRRA